MVAATGVILAALYLLWAYQRVFHGEPDEANKRVRRAQAAARALVLLPLIGVIVFTGVYPKPMLDRIEPSVDRLIAHVERARRRRDRPGVADREPGEPSRRADAEDGADDARPRTLRRSRRSTGSR